MGMGVAREFKKRYPNLKCLSLPNNQNINTVGSCILIDNVFNLITKDRYWHKPTYETLTKSLVSMKWFIETFNITYVAMPRIGCGLDKLQWGRVKGIIGEVFDSTDVEILVCYL